jgi:hypothetical protein
MRKDKISYLVLLAEVVAIVWLHSVKTPDTKPDKQQEFAERRVSPGRFNLPATYIQTAHRAP